MKHGSCADEHRTLNGQPRGIDIGSGGCPGIAFNSLFDEIEGSDESNARVYGCFGSLNN